MSPDSPTKPIARADLRSRSVMASSIMVEVACHGSVPTFLLNPSRRDVAVEGRGLELRDTPYADIIY